MFSVPKRLLTVAFLASSSFVYGAGDPDAICREFLARTGVPGVAYAVLVNGSLVARGAWGFSNVSTREKVTLTSVFPIASLSKPFVAMGVLSLAESGKLDLKQSIGKYLPELPDSWKSIPILRLLDHTSGVPDHLNESNMCDGKPIASDALIKKLVTLPLNFPPGQEFRYSNGNYVLLAKLIERASGEPYEKYLGAKIFDRLGMTHTRALGNADMTGLVTGYAILPNGPSPRSTPMDWCYGNGALAASVLDLSKLDSGLYTERLLRRGTLAYLTTPQPLGNGKLNDYAMGWVVSQVRGARTISHSGRVGGWESMFARFVDANTTVIILSNAMGVSLGTLSADLAGTVVPSLALSPIPDSYPGLTVQHRRFVESIASGQVDPSVLSSALAADYTAKQGWQGIREALRAGGEILSFKPVERSQRGTHFHSIYRLDTAKTSCRIELSWDAQGVFTGLMFGGA